jgi:hypothetical protein
MKDNLTATDAKEIEREVTDSIRNDIKAGLVDMTVAVASSVEGDTEEEEDTGLLSDEASVDLPKSPYGIGMWSWGISGRRQVCHSETRLNSTRRRKKTGRRWMMIPTMRWKMISIWSSDCKSS